MDATNRRALDHGPNSVTVADKCQAPLQSLGPLICSISYANLVSVCDVGFTGGIHACLGIAWLDAAGIDIGDPNNSTWRAGSADVPGFPTETSF